MSDIAIKIEGISKRFSVGKQKDGSLRGALGNVLKTSAGPTEEFWALKNVSFEVNRGEVLGIIGKNGAGKSTLLKVLSQITKPTEGKIEIYGRVASLLEVGTGFHPELTGRENIFLNGTILGMSRKEVKQKFDEIVEFSGVQKFIDTPVKHYSSGMYVRLAFAVAAHLDPEILIIDEVLAVGDAEFQKKCLGKMQDVANQGRTVLFVSHNLGAVQSLCTKSVIINKGELEFYGSTQEGVNRYLNSGGSQVKLEHKNSSDFEISSYGFKNEKEEPSEIVLMGSSFSVFLKYNAKQPITGLVVRMIIFDSTGNSLTVLNNFHSAELFNLEKGEGEISCKVDKNPLYEGIYKISLLAFNFESNEVYYDEEYFCEMEVMQGDYFGSGKIPVTANKGVFLMDNSWNIE